MRQKSLMRSCKHTNTIRPIYREKQHCNLSNTNLFSIMIYHIHWFYPYWSFKHSN